MPYSERAANYAAIRRSESMRRAFTLSGLPARHIEQSKAGLIRHIDWTTALDKVIRVILHDGLVALIGSPGSGKTQIAVEVAKAHLRAASHIRPIRYEVLADAFALCREAYGPAAKRTEMDVIREFTSPQLLILDEIDKSAGSDSEQRLLHRILDKRYRSLLPTLLIGNVDGPDGLQQILDGFKGDGIGPLFDRLRQTGGVVTAFGFNFRGNVDVQASKGASGAAEHG